MAFLSEAPGIPAALSWAEGTGSAVQQAGSVGIMALPRPDPEHVQERRAERECKEQARAQMLTYPLCPPVVP